MVVYVIFSDGLHKGSGTNIKATKTRVCSAYAMMGSFTHIGHVSIGYGGYVLDPQRGIDKIYKIRPYLTKYPGIVYCIQVEAEPPISIEHLSRSYRGRKCSQTVCRVLRLCGVRVGEIKLPGNLFRWLVKNGYNAEKIG